MFAAKPVDHSLTVVLSLDQPGEQRINRPGCEPSSLAGRTARPVVRHFRALPVDRVRRNIAVLAIAGPGVCRVSVGIVDSTLGTDDWVVAIGSLPAGVVAMPPPGC